MTSSVNPGGLAPAGPKRQQRGIQLPQLLLSLLVVAVFALLAVWWQASTTSRTPVLALANDVEVGTPITTADLTEIFISSDVPPKVEKAQFADVFVGALPVADFSAGTFVTTEMFVRAAELGPGQALVGLVLDGNRAPTSLRTGDRVQVLNLGDDDEVITLSADAEVELATYAGTQAFVRLRLDVDAAQLVQLNSTNVVLIEIDNSGVASWETGGDS